MRYRILGPTQALRDDGTPVAIGGARLRALLTVLALRAGRTVPVGALAEEVWGGAGPADSTGALQALVGRLRRALGHAAITSVDGGYRLCAEPRDVDLYRFERLTAEGVRALDEGDSGRAADLLDDALGLWHGPALADLPDRTAEAAGCEARRLTARRARLTAALALGRAEEALPELAALCDDHPIDELLQALRLRALRDAGRTAEALAAYEEVRRDLAARLGADPGPELRALHAELLTPSPLGVAAPTDPGTGGGRPSAHRPAVNGSGAWGGPDGGGRRVVEGARISAYGAEAGGLGAAGRPAAGTAASASASADRRTAGSGGPASVPGRGGAGGNGRVPDPGPTSPGPTHPSPDAGQSSRTDPGPLTTSRPAAGNLRARLTSFVGRETDIEVVRDDLAGARLVTLLGPGGAGKTRLSQEAAEAGDAAWPDGVWLAELAPVDDPATVPEAVLAALGARETVLRRAGAEGLRVAERHGDDPLLLLTEHCSRRHMLILLDNCEHVIGAAARLAEELLARCPGVTVLATSREPLGVPGEVVRPVEPLPDPMALRLLADRGAAAKPGFRIEDDPAAAAEICRRLDGLPLAIELAAARLRMLTPRQIADRLDDRFRLLTGGSRTVLPRQQTLRAVVDWSWDLLDEKERAALRALSVFAGGCDLTAVEAVCGPDALELLGSLVDKSLVVAAPWGGAGGPENSEALEGFGPSEEHAHPGDADDTDGTGMRYRLLETVAEYAAERLDEAGERVGAERRHLVHFRELARRADPLLRGSRQHVWISRLQAEYENLRTALRRAVAARDEHEALCLVHCLAWYWQIRDLRADARHWSLAAAELGPDPFESPITPAPALHERCTDAPPPMAPEQLMEARRGARLIHLASMNHEFDDWTTTEGLAWLRRVVQVYRPGLPQTCRAPGTLWFFAIMLTGEVGQLREVVDATVDASREFGYEWELAAALQTRANILANRSDWVGDASRDADESLEIFTRLGDSWGAAEALSARGEAHERSGEFALAASDFRAAVGHARRLGAYVQVSLLRARLAGVLMETGDGEQAEAMLRDILATVRNRGHEHEPAARLYLAMWLGRTGRTAEARAQLDKVRKDFKRSNLAIFEGFVLGLISWLDNLDGRHGRALTGVRRALARSCEPLSRMVAPQMPAAHLMTAARALAGLGGPRHAPDAARLLGAYEALLPPGHFATGQEREARTDAETATRAALGDAAYEAAYAEGRTLTLEEAVALV
ncbi:BTAD domain-containing putative transcriptional regulator [Streptomyces sp. H27-C3]|uniref:AfsR/SARP family transcriptional regulator n=1 Tax=Streptomyces sp. H27-C3 TaxID=3046305 RepID=UPI0024B93743|nr:BTAD domain-containing putative transcriptional regulator [Streptomyces sp. H27-C3]MDJ0466513.1 BTAD domain-containing putative transcriptional regulator [Streptomyces sp. H27-C3]